MKRLLSVLLIVVFLLSSLCACQARQHPSASFFLMDTVITVTLYADDETAQPILAECRVMIAELERLWSRTVEGSDTVRFNQSGIGEVAVDERTISLIRTAKDVSFRTGGAFDVTVAPLVTLWQACEREGRLPSEREIAAARATISSEKLLVRDGTLEKMAEDTCIDLGGIGKGAAISQVVAYIESTGVAGGIVSFGSNVAVIGSKPNGSPFRIAIRDPKDQAAYVGTLTMSHGEVLSVSGDYERFYEIGGERYHHILDPQTGYPSASGLSSVAVVCRDGALADALSTALLVMGKERAMALYSSGVYDFEAVLIEGNGAVSTTSEINFITK